MTQPDPQSVPIPEPPDDQVSSEEELLFLEDDLSIVDGENDLSQDQATTESPPAAEEGNETYAASRPEEIDAQIVNAITAGQDAFSRLESDPIRLYFNDIGKVDLLGVDEEFWLAARMMAVRRLDVIGRQHPIARRGVSPVQGMYRAVFAELRTAWYRVRDDIKRWKFACPDLLSILDEARTQRR